MGIGLWLSFVLATAVFVLIPGPTVLQCISDALANQGSPKWSTICGVGFGDIVAMSLSLLGVGAVLGVSAAAFTAIKVVGTGYLLYLGVRAIVSARRQSLSAERVKARKPEAAAKRFSRAAAVTLLNPNGIPFFVAFVPQFLAPSRPFAPQAALLLVTFVILAMADTWLYMTLADRLGSRLETPASQRAAGYASGGALLTAAVLILLAGRA